MRIPALHELQAFEAAARLGSFAYAAKELHVTESAISHRIRGLERDLGIALFTRAYRRVVLTEAGAAYCDSIRDAFDALAEARRRVDALRRPTVRVVVPAALGARTLGPLFARFCVENADVALRIAVWDPRTSPLPARADVAVVFSDQPIAGYDALATIRQSLYAVASPGYLAAVGIREPSGMRRASLLHHPALSWRDWFRAAGVGASEGVIAGPVYEDGTTMLESAAHGLGAALSPSLAVAPWIAARLLERCFAVSAQTLPYVIHVSRRGVDRQVAAHLATWLARKLADAAAPAGERSAAGASCIVHRQP